jgi:hypothetical protein
MLHYCFEVFGSEEAGDGNQEKKKNMVVDDAADGAMGCYCDFDVGQDGWSCACR